MSYSLEFLTIELDSLQKFFSKGDSLICERVIKLGNEIYGGDSKELRFIWKDLVTSMSGGSLGKHLATQKNYGLLSDFSDHISQPKSLVFAAIIRQFCQPIGGIYHSSSAGEIFRTEPFEYLKTFDFFDKINPFLFLERPLFNQLPDALPSWGGLNYDELASLSLSDLTNAQIDSGDSDVDCWVNQILILTEEAKLRKCNLITLYE